MFRHGWCRCKPTKPIPPIPIPCQEVEAAEPRGTPCLKGMDEKCGIGGYCKGNWG